jgi:hypothetical protein
MDLSRERGVLYVLRFALRGYLLLFGLEAQKLLRLAGGRLLGQPLVHVIGDSHSWALRKCPGSIIHNIGPATAYNLVNVDSSSRYGAKLFNIVRRVNWRKDTVLLVFGEIDCRVHIYNHFMKSGGTVSMSELIDRTIRNYGLIMTRLKEMGIRFCVYGIIPATGHVVRYPPYATDSMRKRMYEDFTRRFPYQASPETCSAINREFNAKLKRYCVEHGHRYFDIYTKIADEHGFVKAEYRKDEIHVNCRVDRFVNQWLADERAGLRRPGTLTS